MTAVAEIRGPDMEICAFAVGGKCLCQSSKELRAFKTKEGQSPSIIPAHHGKTPLRMSTLQRSGNLACVLFNYFAN